MRWTEGFIAADWGTTNRRAYLIGGDGRCTAEFEDDRGVLSLAREQFPAAVAEIRERLGQRPLLLAGMIGSNRGWLEAPYAPCPAGLADLAAALAWAEPGRTAIVPGVSYADDGRADVMRGEEVQVLGALACGSIPADGLVCHPGTHNKWVELERGRIVRFRSIMTGELFNLLKEHSILAELLAKPSDTGDSFVSGVRYGLENCDLTAELFAARARVLLGRSAGEEVASYVSGLLIGADIRAGCADGGTVIVMGRPELTRLYCAALAAAGRASVQIDGETAFIAGARRIAELIDECS